jgi:Flp pilus assembly protein TadG
MLHRPPRRRSGATTMVELAFCYPILLMLTLGVIVIGLGVFRYQQVASLACEASRWACVHGSNYASTTGKTAATSANIRSLVVSMSAGLDPSQLTVTAYLVDVNGNATAWDSSTKSPTYTSAGTTYQNRVKVVISYTWIPEAYLPSITMSSTSIVPMAF